MENNKRIIGFDLARAYAILGMYIVNFNIVFGNYDDKSAAGIFLSLFSGNSSTVFVILAGMGLALMTNKTAANDLEKGRVIRVICKRAFFLIILGLLLMLWWPADILHFYGLYMLVSVLVLFLQKKYYLWVAAFAIIGFHLLVYFIPFETGWNFNTLEYKDLWTIKGFARNTFYNGWNALFPWLAYFMTGLYLGRLNWQLDRTRVKIFYVGMAMYLSVLFTQFLSPLLGASDDLIYFLNADYLPPFLPFLVSTTGFGLMLISFFMYISKNPTQNTLVKALAQTGQMTLTHYVSHLTLGMVILGLVTANHYGLEMQKKQPLQPVYLLLFALAYFAVSYLFTYIWSKKYKQGPLEMIMRKISG